MSLPTRSSGPSDEPLVGWPTYEPAGFPGVELSEADLLQHVLVIGSTGSGKTTLHRGAIRQLIDHQVSLLVLDAKADDTVQFLGERMRRSGRTDGLVVLGPQGTHAFPLFGRLRTLEDVEPLTELVMLATDPVADSFNPYWRNATAGMISAALTLLLFGDKPVTFTTAVQFMRRWFVSLDGSNTLPKGVADVVERARREAGKRGASPQLQGALDHVEVWRRLDGRTRSNLQSCLLQVLRAFSSAPAARCLEAKGHPAFCPSEIATENRVCVVSVNALTHPALAKFLLRLVRRVFFDAVQRRGVGNHALAGLVADELPLIVQAEDVDQLATLRSRRCFVIAASQSLCGLDQRIGAGLRRALLLNFGTLVFLRTREPEAGEFATWTLGLRAPRPGRPRDREWAEGALLTAASPPDAGIAVAPVPVCPPGELGRLEPHQGFVARADGSCGPGRVWFVPWFEVPGEADLATPAPLAPPQTETSSGATRIRALIHRLGLEPHSSAKEVDAVARRAAVGYQEALAHAKEFFHRRTGRVPEGLDSLPGAWLAGLPGILWALRRPRWTHLPYQVERVGCEDGLLLMDFAQEPEPHQGRFSIWDEVRITVNLSIYPNRWRRLLRRHQLGLKLRRSAPPNEVRRINPDSPSA